MSYAREICRWTGSLPDDARAAADEILLAAAAAGLELPDLAAAGGGDVREIPAATRPTARTTRAAGSMTGP